MAGREPGTSAEQHNGYKRHTKRNKYNYTNIKKLRKSLQKSTRYHDDPFGNVVNHSKQTFTYFEFKLLNRNLNFIPNPSKYNTHQLQTDTNNFLRSIILRSHFGKNNNKKLDPYHALKESNNEWLPKKVHHTVDSFIEKFQKDLSKLKPNTNRNKDNLTKPERHALNQLKLREDIIIMRADKGGAVVIMDIIDYAKEGNRQLNNTNYYAELSYDPTKQH